MGIADERRMAELRYRRSRNKALMHAVGYITSIIPAVLIAFNFEAFREYVVVAFGGRLDRPSQVAAAASQPAPSPVRRPAEPRRVEQPRREPRVEPQQPVPVRNVQPTRAVVKPPKPQDTKPDLTFILDLDRKRQVVIVPGIGPGQHVLLKRDRDDECKVSYGSEVAMSFGGEFNPRAVLSLEDKEAGATLTIEYVVDSLSGRQLPFTKPNLAAIRRRTARNATKSISVLSALEAEQSKVDTYLKSYRGKLWTEKRAAEDRRAALPSLIAAAGEASRGAAQSLASVDVLIERANDVHGSNVELFVAAPE
jgi:hypothetical protein